MPDIGDGVEPLKGGVKVIVVSSEILSVTDICISLVLSPSGFIISTTGCYPTSNPVAVAKSPTWTTFGSVATLFITILLELLTAGLT